MAAPKRIQRKRTKGWRMPEGAIYVGRPTKWGNPFRADYDRAGHRWRVLDDNGVDYEPEFNSEPSAQRGAVSLYFRDLVYWSDKHLSVHELRGKDLACWCPIDQPCHVDVLLDLANRGDPQ